MFAFLACSPDPVPSEPTAPEGAAAPAGDAADARDPAYDGDEARDSDLGGGGASSAGDASVELVTDDRCTNPCTFSARTTGGVVRLAYDADGYALGSTTADDTELTYRFNQLGERSIRVAAYDADGTLVAEDARMVTVESDLPDVPYFYQYDNELYPSSTCQNTSIAMVLAWYGWEGEPDEVTAAYGKDTAQTVAGLASVFNSVAADAGITARLTGHTDGDIDDMKALLDRGVPVIVHGYFTAYGHVLVVLGYDDTGYTVNDPAGSWNEIFQGSGYGGGEGDAGDHIRYEASAFETAIVTWDGSTPAPLWYHELR